MRQWAIFCICKSKHRFYHPQKNIAVMCDVWCVTQSSGWWHEKNDGQITQVRVSVTAEKWGGGSEVWGVRGHVPTSQYWTAGQDTREELSWAACRHAAQGNIIMRHHQDNTLVCRNQLKVHYLVQLLGSHNQRNHCIVIVLLCGWSSSDRQTDRQSDRQTDRSRDVFQLVIHPPACISVMHSLLNFKLSLWIYREQE